MTPDGKRRRERSLYSDDALTMKAEEKVSVLFGLFQTTYRTLVLVLIVADLQD